MYWLLLTIPAVIVVIAYYSYRECFFSSTKRNIDPYSRKMQQIYDATYEDIQTSTKVMDNTPGEDVFITSFDGLQLHGRYYQLDRKAPLTILFHGYRGNYMRDCSGGFMLSRKLGMNVLAVEQRSHGRSQGNTISFGILERKDCLSWARYASARFGEDIPIVLSGISMGGATVLMASQLPLPGNVVAILADCPYTSPKEIICKVCTDRKLPAPLAYPFVRLGARLFGNFSLEEASALEAVSYANVPILLIHGDTDDFVPYEMTKRIYTACKSDCRMVLFPKAGHGVSYLVDPVGYERAIVEFLWNIPGLTLHLCANDYAQKMLNEGFGD